MVLSMAKGRRVSGFMSKVWGSVPFGLIEVKVRGSSARKEKPIWHSDVAGSFAMHFRERE